MVPRDETGAKATRKRKIMTKNGWRGENAIMIYRGLEKIFAVNVTAITADELFTRSYRGRRTCSRCWRDRFGECCHSVICCVVTGRIQSSDVPGQIQKKREQRDVRKEA